MEKPVKVVVIHEEADGRTLICNLLAAGGCRPLAAGSARDAMQLARHERPDLIVMALPVPDVASLGLLQDLCRDLRLRKVPVICVASVDPRGVFPAKLREPRAPEGPCAALVFLKRPLAADELLRQVRALTAPRGKNPAHPRPRRGG